MARLYAGAAALLGLASAAAMLVTRAELASPGLQVVSRGGYDATVSLHASLAMLAVTVAFLGFAAPSGPLAKVALAVILVGAVVLAIGLTRRSGDYGWFAYAPLPSTRAAPVAHLARIGQVLTGLGVAGACFLVVRAAVPARRWVLGLPAGILGVLALVRLFGRPGQVTTLDEAALALPFAALLLQALVSGRGVARWWAVGGLVTVGVGVATYAGTNLTDSYTDLAVSHTTLVAVMLFGLFAALYQRWDAELPGRVHLALFFTGYQITFAAMAWLGREGMPRRYADYLPQDGFTGNQRLVTAGAVVLVLSFIPPAVALRGSKVTERPMLRR